ncbi:MAG: hypothetical protein AB9Q17_02380 [Candidatus Reddybacter sp.]
MTLTPVQKATLKTYIEANPTWMAYSHNADGASQIAEDLQAIADPVFTVWRTSVSEDEYTASTSREATDWSWTEYISRSIGEKAGYERMFNTGSIDPSKPNIRQGFVDVFSGGQQAAVDQRDHMAAVSKRDANLLEKLFAAGLGSTGSPGTMVIEGSLRYRDVLQAMGWQ